MPESKHDVIPCAHCEVDIDPADNIWKDWDQITNLICPHCGVRLHITRSNGGWYYLIVGWIAL